MKNFAVWPPEQANINESTLSPFSHVRLFATPWAVAHQAPLSIGLSKQKYWSGESSSPPGDLIDTGIDKCLLSLLHWQAGSWPLSPFQFSFSRSVMPNSLQPHESQHARPPCPSATPGVHPNSCPLSRWCHPSISSSVVPFSSCPQSFPASGSFQMSQLFAWGGQSIGVSASTSVLPMNTQDWAPLGWTGWISLQSKGLSRVFSNNTVQKLQFFGAQLSLWSNSHLHTYWKNHSFD